MRLKILGVFKKPLTQSVPKESKFLKKKETKEQKNNEGYHIISTETVPVEFYCELPPKVREQLIRNLAGGIDYTTTPAPDIPQRTIISAI